MEVPKCAVESCDKDGFVQVLGKFVCGACCIRISKEINDRTWENINASSKNTGN